MAKKHKQMAVAPEFWRDMKKLSADLDMKMDELTKELNEFLPEIKPKIGMKRNKKGF